MYKGKHLKKGCAHKRPAALLASLVLLLSVSVVGTVAYLMHSTEDVTNTFTLGQVPNKVVETIEDNVKKDVKIQNLGDVDAYVRAAVVVNWIETDASGNQLGISAVEPITNLDCDHTDCDCDYKINWSGIADGSWKEDGGYYYYTGKVSPNEKTSPLFTGCTQLKFPKNRILSVEIMGQTIQADGMGSNDKTPVEDAWENDTIDITVNQDKTLSITTKPQGGAGA